MAGKIPYVLFIILAFLLGSCDIGIDPDRLAEKHAIPSENHPYAGFWKFDNCDDDWGLAISPAQTKTYFISFCGPGGCFKEGTYWPETDITHDKQIRLIDANRMEIGSADGFRLIVRCSGRTTKP